MPKLDITADEQKLISDAISMAITSAQRAQKSGKSPQIVEVYKTHERTLQALDHKISQAK